MAPLLFSESRQSRHPLHFHFPIWIENRGSGLHSSLLSFILSRMRTWPSCVCIGIKHMPRIY